MEKDLSKEFRELFKYSSRDFGMDTYRLNTIITLLEAQGVLTKESANYLSEIVAQLEDTFNRAANKTADLLEENKII